MSTHDFDDSPALLSLAALVPGGLVALDQGVIESLGRDDYSGALKRANERYAVGEGRDLSAALTYAILLTHRELADEALGVLRKALGYHTHEVVLQLAQIDALFARGDYDAATALMGAIAEVSISDPRHWAYLGDMFWDTEDPGAAMRAYEEAARRGSHEPDVALRLADLYARDERYWEAAEQFERAGRLAPGDGHVWSAVTEAWMGLEAWDRAIHAAKRTVKLTPDDPQSWALLGAAHREAGEAGEALKAFERARNLDPEDPLHWLNLGALQLDIGLPDEARQSYQRAAALDTSDVEAINGMVAAAYDLGDVELALRLAHRALELVPDHPDALYNLGVVSLSLHDAEQAEEAFTLALQADPFNAHLLAGRATAILLQGDIEGALATAEQALTYESSDAELVLEFTQFLFRHGGAQIVLDFVTRVTCEDPVWAIVVPVFEYLAHALRRDARVEAAVVRFVEAVHENRDAIPVYWDFDELERLSVGLDDEDRDRFLEILAVLDGRREVDTLGRAA